MERGGRSSSSTRARSRTAEAATEWVPIRPGADALPAHGDGAGASLSEGLVDLGGVRRPRHGPRRGRGRCRAVHARGGGRTPPASTPTTSAGSPGSWPPRPRPCVYGRIGTTHGGVRHPHVAGSSTCSTCSPATSTGPAAPCSPPPRRAPATPVASRGIGREVRLHRRTSRVRGLPETFGELPAVVPWRRRWTPPATGRSGPCSPWPGTRCSPRRTPPASTRPSAGLECMVAVDIYVNETTRHADVILPAPSALQKGHYDVALLQLALRDTSNSASRCCPLDDRPARRVGGPGPAGAGAAGRRAPPPIPRWSTT